MNIIKYIQRIRCWFVGHDYTCATKNGVDPTEEQLANGIEGFFDYAKLLCKNCDFESRSPYE